MGEGTVGDVNLYADSLCCGYIDTCAFLVKLNIIKFKIVVVLSS